MKKPKTFREIMWKIQQTGPRRIDMIKKTAKIVRRLRDEQNAKVLMDWLPYLLNPKKYDNKCGNVIVYNRLAKIKK